MGPCNRYKRGIRTEKEEGIPIVERKERGSMRVHIGTTEERIYPTLKVTSNSTGVLCREEEQKEENSTGL